MRDADEAAIVATALDYFEGWFGGDPVRMERALHPGLAKRAMDPEEGGALSEETFRSMVDATERGVGTTRLPADGDPRIDVEVVDVYDTIASVTVRSAVYHEYLHMVRTPSGWKIANALWQRTLSGGQGR